jgi:hypothetical protein
VIEFGVAGGNGLLALERLADAVESIFPTSVDVLGFDTGAGLPKPADYRDMPNLWSEGWIKMDVSKLRSRLSRARLILGLVGQTVPEIVQSGIAPVGFVSFDVDFYSSTLDALKLFDAGEQLLMPRIYCYFDDILGFTFGDHVGERLAITDFNASHVTRKTSPIYGLRYYVSKRYQDRHVWEKMYMAHIFDHSLYGELDGSMKDAGLELWG